jgi:hypothetical protein
LKYLLVGLISALQDDYIEDAWEIDFHEEETKISGV